MKRWILSVLALSLLSVPALAQEAAPAENMQCQSSRECTLAQGENPNVPDCTSIHSTAAQTMPWPAGKEIPPGGLKCGCLKSIGACAYAPPNSLK